MRRTAIKQQAEDAIRPVLHPGERTRAGAAVASGPTRWSSVWVAAMALTLIVEAVVGVFGPQSNLASGSLLAAVGVGFPLLAIGMMSRPMYIAVSDQRLIGLRLSRLGSTPRRLAFAAPLTDIRITDHRSGRSESSIRCEIRGRGRTRLSIKRSWYPEFAEVSVTLRHSGAMTEWDVPYPPAANPSDRGRR